MGAEVGQNLSEGREQRGKQENREPPQEKGQWRGIIEIPEENVGYLTRPAGLEPATLSSED